MDSTKSYLSEAMTLDPPKKFRRCQIKITDHNKRSDVVVLLLEDVVQNQQTYTCSKLKNVTEISQICHRYGNCCTEPINSFKWLKFCVKVVGTRTKQEVQIELEFIARFCKINY